MLGSYYCTLFHNNCYFWSQLVQSSGLLEYNPRNDLKMTQFAFLYLISKKLCHYLKLFGVAYSS